MKSIEMLREILANQNNINIKKHDGEGNIIFVVINVEKPSDTNMITKIENELKKSLPNEYIEFLLEYNGGRLFDFEGLDGIKLFGTNEIVKVNNYSKLTFEDDWFDDVTIFAKYIGEDNYLGFKYFNDNYYVVDCYFEELPQDWKIIANNFDEFLTLLIEEKGHKYWLDN